MKSFFRLLALSVFLLQPVVAVAAQPVEIYSPDRALRAEIRAGESLSVHLFEGSDNLIGIERIAMETDRGTLPASGARVKKVRRESHRGEVIPQVKEKMAEIPDRYEQATLDFAGGVTLQFRLYDDGLAYRFVTALPGEMTVKRENASFSIAPQGIFTFQRDNRPGSDYEASYVSKPVGELTAEDMGNLPALVELPGSRRLLFLESDVKDYPVMWLRTDSAGRLGIHQWGYPAAYNVKGNSYNRKNVLASHDYIARVAGERTFPWRIVVAAREDKELMANQLVYLLAPECRIDDPSWIRPGWVMFDWWAKHGVFGVDFKAGINTETAKYMIDFASEFGMRYFLFDDGWTDGEDLTRVIPGLDMEEVTAYARSRNVDVMLWVTFALFDDQMEKALEQFEAWGIRGLKIDFMNRSDQEVTDFYWRAAEACARHRMVLNFHGAYKPDGLRRAYPNVLTREALIEFEYNGGSEKVTPDHDCTLPFIRNVAGPMDYIPGTMYNAARGRFRIIGQTPMGQGTRAHSMAMAVVFESPMQMLPDSPSTYYREQECARFLTGIPVTWDEIRPLAGKVGDYVAVARRHGSDWYVGAITDWTERRLTLDFDFLEEGKEYTMELFRDGVNAHSMANDYRKESRSVRKGDKIAVDMAPGGGWVARIY